MKNRTLNTLLFCAVSLTLLLATFWATKYFYKPPTPSLPIEDVHFFKSDIKQMDGKKFYIFQFSSPVYLPAVLDDYSWYDCDIFSLEGTPKIEQGCRIILTKSEFLENTTGAAGEKEWKEILGELKERETLDSQGKMPSTYQQRYTYEIISQYFVSPSRQYHLKINATKTFRKNERIIDLTFSP
ncbi:hypothetical protein [Andreprevotia chitinilytica]|uniref:hypothetical protein n=1 Tax=Andreprevotia chitinilytica TaxID=396808 RepID=UPI0012EBC543|nr:hypothetical protein [Andreprevotia chitinilytica]